jgi:uncharacterized membrane protein
MSILSQAQAPAAFRPKYIVFAIIAVMMAYVLYHNESFLLIPDHPVWGHYQTFRWWLLAHGLAGGLGLVLVPMQFSDRLRARYTKFHRIIGRIYVACALTLAPLGVLIQYFDEAQGAARSFTIATMIDAAILMTTTGMGLYFALKRMIPQHRQWMTRSYAVSLVFIQVRVILGVPGLDQPFDWAVTETVVWSCVALSLLIADLANQVYELRSARRAVRAAAAPPVRVGVAAT